MGKILFETSNAMYELEKPDQEVLAHFRSITGIKIIAKQPISSGMTPNTASEKTVGKPFNSEMIPGKADIIAFIESHLDGYNTAMLIQHFFGYVPKYGESDEQDRLIAMLNTRINRARKVIASERHGDFEMVTKDGNRLYVFKQLKDGEMPSNDSIDDDESISQKNKEDKTSLPNF